MFNKRKKYFSIEIKTANDTSFKYTYKGFKKIKYRYNKSKGRIKVILTDYSKRKKVIELTGVVFVEKEKYYI